MKTHKLFLLALTALCSMGVWGEPVTFGPNGDVPFSATANVAATSEDGNISVVANFASSQHSASASPMLVYNFLGNGSGYDYYVDFKATNGCSLKKISLFFNNIYGNNGVFQIQYEGTSSDIAINAGAWSTTPGQTVDINISDDGITSARLTKKSGYWDYTMLVSATITAESAPAGPTHQVIYAAGGAQGTVPATKEVEETKNYKLAQPTNLTYEGHLFTGWKSSADNNVYPAGTQMTMGTADVTYTAQWKVGYIEEWGEKQSITPIRNFGTAGTKALTIAYNGEENGGLKMAENVNGWGYSGVSAYKPKGNPTYMDIELSEDIFSTMEISELTYSIGYLGGPKLYITYASTQHFDASAAVGDPVELTNGNAQNENQKFYTISIPSGVRSARITTQNNAQGETYLYYLKVTVAELSLPFFNVTYNANGATGTAPADDKAYEGTPYTLAEPTELEKIGFVFTGWKSSIDEEVYAAGTSLEITDDVEFTAQWEEDLDDPTITFRDTIYIVDESTLDLSKLFKSNSTGAVTYSVKDAGTTGAAVSGSVFTATATGTAIVTASQARVEGAYNAKSVDATIIVKAYAKTADFYAEAAKASPMDVYQFMSSHYYTLSPNTAHWDAQRTFDGGLGLSDGKVYTFSFWVQANKKVTIKVGILNGDGDDQTATVTQKDIYGNQIAEATISRESTTDYTTTQETQFVITTKAQQTWSWSRIQIITITDMSPKTVSFDTHGGTPETIEPLTEESFGAGITLPDAPTKTDYIFDGWYTAATGGTLAGNAGETYKPADNCTLHAHWVGYAKTVDFMDAAKRQTPQPTVADFLAANNYTMSPLRDAKWDDNNYGAPDAGLKVEDSDRDFSFWVAAGKQVTIQLGTWQGNYEGANKPELYANGEKLLDLKTSQQANDPIIVTEDTKFVIKIVNPWWSSIQIITIEDAPLPEITISDQAEDNSVLVANEGKTVNVQLERELTGGMFNTICLPFDLSADQIANSALAGAQIVQLVSTSLESQKLYLEYEEVETIEAGKGYLIAPLADVTDPSFEAVTISKTEATEETVGVVTVKPTFIISDIPADPANLYLYLDNTLYYPNNDLQIDGLRLYYHVNGEANLMPARMRMVGRGTPTDINIFPYEGKTEIGSAKFIHKGHLYILRGGKLYNAHGQIAK